MSATASIENGISGSDRPHDLIGSDRVDGTKVYRPNGDHIGHIERIMIDKRTGQAAYAVMNFGGFLGLGEESYPLPWALLKYDPELGGYAIDLTEEQLKNAPKFMDDDNFDMGDRYRHLYDYYGLAPFG